MKNSHAMWLCVAAGIAVIAGVLIDARTVLAAYLIVWIAIASIPIGALAWLQLSYLIRRSWTTARPADPARPGAVISRGGQRSRPAGVQGGLSRAMVLCSAHAHLYRDLVSARAVGQGSMGKSGANDPCSRRGADRLRHHGFAGGERLASIS